jgi:hypothetical protein
VLDAQSGTPVPSNSMHFYDDLQGRWWRPCNNLH